MTTHFSYDPYVNPEIVAEVRETLEGAVPLRRA